MPMMAINQMTMATSSTVAVMDMAASLGFVGVELRNDLAAGLFDGMRPAAVRASAQQRNLRILALAEVYAFNEKSDAIVAKVSDLLSLARSSGAEAIVLIPNISNVEVPRAEQRRLLRAALDILQPLLADSDVIALIEPLGFSCSSLQYKQDVVDVLDDMGRPKSFALIHDTFHHALAGEKDVFVELTHVVHVSGVTDPTIVLSQMQDAHRGLVDQDDRLGNVSQINQLLNAGYNGPFSFEAFAPDVHALNNPMAALSESSTFIASQVA